MMMRMLTRAVLAMAVLFTTWCPSVAYEATKPAPGSFIALCYHNIEDQDPDQTYDGVTTSRLIEQLSWLQHEGYTAISIDDLLAARAGRKSLPEKAMLLSFDDGYASFYTRVYPVLRAFHFPAVVGVVDEWMTTKPGHGGQGGDHGGERVHYGDTTLERSAFLTWAQLREMRKSGLIEVASHSDAMHYGVIANPQGSSEPDALTTIYNPATATYESSAHYIARLKADAAKSVATIKRNVGMAPRVMIWPYGAYNEIGMLIQNQKGMPITMSLEDGYATVNTLKSTPRLLIKDDPSLSDFSISIRQYGKTAPMRMIEVSLDTVYNPDPEQEAKNLDALVQRVHDMAISIVFLKAYTDPTGDGVAREVYFPNRFLPVRRDLFNRVAWQLNNRSKVVIYGELPVTSFDFGNADDATSMRDRITGLYEDFGRSAPVAGLVFRDRLLSGDAAAGYAAADENSFAFTRELASHVAAYHAPLKIAAVLAEPSDLSDSQKAAFAQNYQRFLQAYDYTVITTDNADKDAEVTTAWLDQSIGLVSAEPNGLKKTVFELQAAKRRGMEKIEIVPTEELGDQMRYLASHGALNFGYSPDDFATNVPDADVLHKDFSLQAYPYLP